MNNRQRWIMGETYQNMSPLPALNTSGSSPVRSTCVEGLSLRPTVVEEHINIVEIPENYLIRITIVVFDPFNYIGK